MLVWTLKDQTLADMDGLAERWMAGVGRGRAGFTFHSITARLGDDRMSTFSSSRCL